MGAKSSQNNLPGPPQERGRREGMAGEHHVGLQLNLRHHAPAPCLDVCREDEEGDESRVGRQHPRHPLKVGDDSSCLWVTACPILLLFPPACSLCHHGVAAWGLCVSPGNTVSPVPLALPRRAGGSPGKPCQVPAPVVTASSQGHCSVAHDSVWVFVCLDGVSQLKVSGRVS